VKHKCSHFALKRRRRRRRRRRDKGKWFSYMFFWREVTIRCSYSKE